MRGGERAAWKMHNVSSVKGIRQDKVTGMRTNPRSSCPPLFIRSIASYIIRNVLHIYSPPAPRSPHRLITTRIFAITSSNFRIFTTERSHSRSRGRASVRSIIDYN